MPRFVDTHVFRKQHFSLGVDTRGFGHYVSLPVSGFNRTAEFEAYFTISEDEYRRFAADPESASGLVADLLNAPDNPRRIG